MRQILNMPAETAPRDAALMKTLSVLDHPAKFLIIHELLGGKKRFNILRDAVGLTARTLIKFLRELAGLGLVTRKVYPEVPSRVEYELTEKAYGLRPVIEAMIESGRPGEKTENINAGD
jgi:DNA-binding HxlR family transcriptional regulator